MTPMLSSSLTQKARQKRAYHSLLRLTILNIIINNPCYLRGATD
ncbi:hypothetical protein QN395_05835 [Undibacterium sp. RTI2.2]|nr:hypothetical protein [Undibacterium sp. RTI2.2]